MSETLIFILIAVIVIGFIGFSLFRSHKQKNSSWSGTVIDKGYDEHVRSNQRRRQPGLRVGGIGIGNINQQHVSVKYYIRVETLAGGELKWPVSEGLYQQINIGDKLSKESGTKIPRITESSQQHAAQPAQATTAASQHQNTDTPASDSWPPRGQY